MVCHGVLACKPGGGLVKLVANQGVGRGWIPGGSGKSLKTEWMQGYRRGQLLDKSYMVEV